MTLFIRDEIPVRQLDKRWKKRARYLAAVAAGTAHIYNPRWYGANILRWECAAAVEKVTLKGA